MCETRGMSLIANGFSVELGLGLFILISNSMLVSSMDILLESGLGDLIGKSRPIPHQDPAT